MYPSMGNQIQKGTKKSKRKGKKKKETFPVLPLPCCSPGDTPLCLNNPYSAVLPPDDWGSW